MKLEYSYAPARVHGYMPVHDRMDLRGRNSGPRVKRT